MVEIKTIESWQLTRLVDRLYRRNISGLYILGFKIHEGGVSLLRVAPLRINEIKTLSAEDIQWYKDVYLRQEHVGLKVKVKGDNIILVGFWAADIDALRKAIGEALPDTSAAEILTARLGGQEL